MIVDNLKIFMVDDNTANLEQNAAHLVRSGYNSIRTFNSGLQCVGKLAEHPDVIFLAYGHSAQTALQVLHQIKDFDPAIQVILLPGANNRDPFNTGARHKIESALYKSAITDYIDHVLSRIARPNIKAA